MNQEEVRSALEAAQQENERLRQELAAAQAVIAQLTTRIERLEGQRAKDSHNSSKPPSSDGPGTPVRKTASLRGKSGKSSGGQGGHAGHTLHMVDAPTRVVEVSATQCAHCTHDLTAEPSCRIERAQVWDVPPWQLQVTEYRTEVKRCPCCQRETRADFPPGIKAAAVQYGPMVRALAVYLQCCHLVPYARTCQILSDLLGTSLTQASVQAALQEGSERVEPMLTLIKEGLISGDILHNDETGVRIAGKRLWLHVATTAQLTWYQWHTHRGKQAADAIGILPRFQGVSIHDSLLSYLQYDCRHALCNVHYLRELTYVQEQYQQPWAKEMKDLLREIKAQVTLARSQQQESLPQPLRAAYEARYGQIVTQALAAHPPPVRVKGTRGRPPRGDEVRNLLCRLQDYRELILRFMYQFEVPFDNNLAEQALRMMKVQQKISGGFRTTEGATIFCRLRSYLATMRKQGVHHLTALQQLFLGSPIFPSQGC